MGIAMIPLIALETLTMTGLYSALVQKEGDVRSYLNVAWTVQLLRGIMIVLVLLAAAPALASLFDAPEATPVIRAVALSFLIISCSSSGMILITKELRYRKQFLFGLGETAANFFVTVIAAYYLRNVWALVLGYLALNTASFMLSYALHPHRPRLDFAWGKTRSLWRFSFWFLATSVLSILVLQSDDFLLGILLGAGALGFYQLAYRVSDLPSAEFANLISKILFPVYSKMQKDLTRLSAAYTKVFQLTVLVALPVSGFICLMARPFTTVFLTDIWASVASYLQVLALFGLMRALAATTRPVFMAVGRPDIQAKLQILQLLVLLPLLFPLIRQWEILGATVAVTLAATVFTLAGLVRVMALLKVSTASLVRGILGPLLGTAAFVAPVYAFGALTSPYDTLIEFCLASAACVGLYLIFIVSTDGVLGSGTVRLVREQIEKLRA